MEVTRITEISARKGEQWFGELEHGLPGKEEE